MGYVKVSDLPAGDYRDVLQVAEIRGSKNLENLGFGADAQLICGLAALLADQHDVRVTVNGRSCCLVAKTVTYDELVVLAGFPRPTGEPQFVVVDRSESVIEPGKRWGVWTGSSFTVTPIKNESA